MFVVNLTHSQLESYRLIRGSFTNFDWSFLGRRRTFGFYGRLRVDEAGSVDLLDLCVACSGKHEKDGLDDEVGQPGRKLRSASAASGSETADFGIELLSAETEHGTRASHLILTYGDSKDLKEAHFSRFERKGEESEDPFSARNEYYPVSAKARPEAARSITVSDLQTLVYQDPVIVLTGAGISTGSGIPSFRGPKGLERHFPLHEPFPGAVAGLMIEKPRELARILARFQAAFIQAEPNEAHRSLADLEARGCVRRVVTGNADKLHEKAGSIDVHAKNPDDFRPGARGWEWFNDGNLLLAVGLGRDEHGLISYSRDNGMKVAAISPDRPEFLHEEDFYIEGKAEDVLPCLAG